VGHEPHNPGASGTAVDTRRGHDTVPAIPGCSEDNSYSSCLGKKSEIEGDITKKYFLNHN